MSFIAFTNNEANALHIYQKTDTVSIISEQPSYMVFNVYDSNVTRGKREAHFTLYWIWKPCVLL